MITPLRQALTGAVAAAMLAGCTPASPQPSPSASAADFSAPGAASNMVDQLLAKAGSQDALMVEVTRSTVQVSVLGTGHKTATWAYRGGEMSEVPSDLAYVDQASFDVARFNLDDVGALFRAAAGMSGSEQSQSLTIVDYSGGEVMMSVSTVPESRTVFFNPDGSLLPVLDFNTPGGITRGIDEAVGTRTSVASVTIDSSQGAWVDYPADTETTIRRTRTAKVPVTTNTRAEKLDLPEFNPARLNADAIWQVVDRTRGSDAVPAESPWNVVIDDRDRIGSPRMHFSFAGSVLTTDLAGREVSR